MQGEILSIKEGAIFIADSHHHSLYQNTLDSTFNELLSLSSRQIFLLGDIFDFLVGGAQKSIKDNLKTLELLEELSLKHTIYYFEGNHDFLLSSIPYFKNIRCFPLEIQPVCFDFGENKAYLAHGDVFLNWHYMLFAKALRQKYLILFLNLFSPFLYPLILKYLQKKKEKKKNRYKNYLGDFKDFAAARVNNYLKKYQLQADSYVIEGHFHQGQIARVGTINYVGLPFFSCKKNFFLVEYADNCLILKEFGSVRL